VQGRITVSSGGRQRPYWRRDGRELFYLAADDSVPAIERHCSDYVVLADDFPGSWILRVTWLRAIAARPTTH
jgi:hypothetical protein